MDTRLRFAMGIFQMVMNMTAVMSTLMSDGSSKGFSFRAVQDTTELGLSFRSSYRYLSIPMMPYCIASV